MEDPPRATGLPPHAPEAEEPRTQVPGRRGQAHVCLMATVVTPHNAAPQRERRRIEDRPAPGAAAAAGIPYCTGIASNR